MRFKDKTVLITGASRGIGKATALAFAKGSAKIVVDYHISEFEPDARENAERVAEEAKNLGGEAMIIACDVSDEEQVGAMFSGAVENFEKIDILVNNAGIVYDAPFFEKNIEQWQRTLDVNLKGCFLCSKYASGYMLKSGGGKIVNISSTNSMNAFSPESADYDASKAGINILTRNLAKELAPLIQVNAVAPGWVNTNMNKDLPRKFVEAETDKIYAGRFAEPEEIAKAALFLASSDADYITGSILKVDGGYG